MAHTEETKQKIKEAWKKRKPTFVPPFKGKKMSDETRAKMREAYKNHPPNHLGKKHTAETKARISAITMERTPRGKNHYAYKTGLRQRNLDARRTIEYRKWREAVFSRDNYTCQDCGDKRGGNLRAHHLMPFIKYPELRFELSNGITLCDTCHNIRHKKDGYKERKHNGRKD